jgi:hypothetical protein
MIGDVVPEAVEDEFADADDGTASSETGFGTIWALLWLVMQAERHAVALAIIGDKTDDAAGAESLRRWAEPQLDACRRDGAVPPIPWPRVARILRDHLPANEG